MLSACRKHFTNEASSLQSRITVGKGQLEADFKLCKHNRGAGTARIRATSAGTSELDHRKDGGQRVCEDQAITTETRWPD